MVILIIALVAVAIILWLQFKSFNQTKKGIEDLKSFFPTIDKVALKECTTNKDAIADRFTLRKVAQNPPSKKDDMDMTDEDVKVSLITTTGGSQVFKEVVVETNEYLCKNVGTSADLNVLQDICDKKLEVKENAIKSTLNLPLYIGLGGTFIGIIIGVIGFALDLNDLFGSTSTTTTTDQVIFVPIADSEITSIEDQTLHSSVESQEGGNSNETNSLQFLL